MSLFMINNRPLKFHLTGLKVNQRAEITELIIENGGQVSNGGDATLYFTNLEGYVPGKTMVDVNYIRDCVKAKQLLHICEYRLGEDTGCLLSTLLLDAPSSPFTLTARSIESLTNGAVPASTEPLVFEGAGDISPTDKSEPAIAADGESEYIPQIFPALLNKRAAHSPPRKDETPMKRRRYSKTARNTSSCQRISSGDSSEDEVWISTSNRQKITSDDPKPGTSKEPDPKVPEIICLNDSSSPTPPRPRNRIQTKVEPAQDRSRDAYVISDSDSPRPGCSNEVRRRCPVRHSDNSTQPGSLKKKSVTLRSLWRDRPKCEIRPKAPHIEWEHMVMIRYLYEKNHLAHSQPKGLVVWNAMIADGYLTHRTPQSLNNDFRSSILPAIERFNIDEDLKELLRSLRDKVL